MNARTLSLLQEASGLDPEQGSALADALLESLEMPSQDGLTEAWRREMRHRHERLTFGQESTVPWEDVKRRILAM